MIFRAPISYYVEIDTLGTLGIKLMPFPPFSFEIFKKEERRPYGKHSSFGIIERK
jgi:hypothetical protein